MSEQAIFTRIDAKGLRAADFESNLVTIRGYSTQGSVGGFSVWP